MKVFISSKLLLYVSISNLFVLLKTICVPIVHEASLMLEATLFKVLRSGTGLRLVSQSVSVLQEQQWRLLLVLLVLFQVDPRPFSVRGV